MFFTKEDERCYSNGADFGNFREFIMPFVDAMGDEAFNLNKSRSMTAFGYPCIICCKCCLSDLCSLDND